MLFLHLISANLKRLKSYIPSIFIAVLILLIVCSIGGGYIAKSIYTSDVMSNIKIGYYLPEDNDKKFNEFGIGMMESMKSVRETVQLTKYFTVEEGYDALEAGDILYYIIVPENFFTGIVTSDNYPLEIVVKDNSTMAAYIANELFMSYAKYLGVAQAGIYSALDTVRYHGYPDEEEYVIQDKVNLIYLDRALNKDGYIDTKEYTDVGSLSLVDHYLVVAVLLSLFFTMFILTPMLQGYNDGMQKILHANKINGLHVLISNFVSVFVALYLAYLPCFFGISILKKHFNWSGLIRILVALLIMATIVSLVNSISKNVFSANMCLFVVVLILTYIGGGIMPSNMLPKIIQQISVYFPGEHLISMIGHALFGTY